ncbi:YhgE/Pip family protein [Halobacillus sp. B23F22_1]|uniref:YhgE/Pip family protein n=1 Tax=Halobacillus sp. B23F22_1 TaxID=3459514 RepID=UPI00373E48F5
MRNIWKIFSNDMKNIGTNWVAAILIGGLTLLPSLYAWFNIEAAWDPYGNTDQLPVAVVNEDAGADVRGEELDVGAELVKQLQDNEKMAWKFVDREEAMEQVEYGDYFAAIIIPENFSSKLGTVVNDQPEKADIEYYVNEKTNAIAPKITESGAGTIVDQITSEFISSVNGVIFEMFNEIGVELESDLPDIKRFENYIFEMEASLPEAHELIEKSLSDANDAQSIIDDAQALLPEAERVTGEGLQTIDETTAYLNKAENRLDEIAPRVQEDLEKVQTSANEINNFMNRVQSSDLNLEEGKQFSARIDEQVATSIENIESVEAALINIQEQSSDRQEDSEEEPQNQQEINQALEQLTALKENLQAVEENSGEVKNFLTENQHEVDELINGLQERADSTASEIDAFIAEYNENIEPRVREEVAQAKTTLGDAGAILEEIQTTIPEVERLLGSTEENLGEGEKTLEYLLGEYPYVNQKINELADRIREIQGETDINELIELLQNDPESERGFYAEPVELNKNSLFPIANYGTGMTAFYTVLAIWVGGLLLISLLATSAVNAERYTEKQIYFGKLFTFTSIGATQALVVSLGDILILGVDIAAPIWFVIFGMFISLVFLLIVYTLVSVFGDVGKAMAIVLLVLQIAGSGGTYPVALLPEFFQNIHPFLPFSYAVDLLREAVGGIVWERVYRDVIFLSLFGLGGLLAGTLLKKPLHKRTQALMKKSKESGLFH